MLDRVLLPFERPAPKLLPWIEFASNTYLEIRPSQGISSYKLGTLVEIRGHPVPTWSAVLLEDSGQKGEPIGDFRKAWASACVAAGVGKMICPNCGKESADRECESCKVATRYSGKIFHDFRRTASRNMIAAGVPQAVAMKITGHRTDSMFRRYAIVNEEQKRDALAKTQNYLAASKGRKIVAMGAGR